MVWFDYNCYRYIRHTHKYTLMHTHNLSHDLVEHSLVHTEWGGPPRCCYVHDNQCTASWLIELTFRNLAQILSFLSCACAIIIQSSLLLPNGKSDRFFFHRYSHSISQCIHALCIYYHLQNTVSTINMCICIYGFTRVYAHLYMLECLCAFTTATET